MAQADSLDIGHVQAAEGEQAGSEDADDGGLLIGRKGRLAGGSKCRPDQPRREPVDFPVAEGPLLAPE